MMRLVHDDTKRPVCIGDTVTSSRGSVYKVVSFHPPHKPSSSGKIVVRNPGAGGLATEESFVHVFNLTWVEREDHGWLHPEVELRKVCEIYKDIWGEEMEGWDLCDIIEYVRSTRISSFPDNKLDDMMIVKKWLDKQ